MSVRASASPLGVNNNKDLPSTLPSKPSSGGSSNNNSAPYVRPSSTSSSTSATRISPSGMDGSGHRASTGPGGLSPNSTSNNAMADGSNRGTNNRFRASVDAPRNVYGAGAGNGHLSLQPGYGSPNLAANAAGAAAQGASPRPGSASKRPSSEMLASFAAGNMNTESDALDKWFEDLHHYEATLEEMAAASLDQSFKEELGAIEQWFRVLSEAERTAALYSLLQTSSQVQIRFFITVLQQMARSDPMNALLSPANPQQSSMEAQMEAKLASLGLKSPASPAVRNFARQSLGAMPLNDAAGFLSPHSAMLQPPPRSSSSGNTNNNDGNGNAGSHESADAATLLAAQRAKLNANAANRISAPGSLLSAYDHNSLRSPLWSQANSEQVAERSGRSPSPDGRSSNASRSRPASMVSDQGLPSAAANSNNNLGGSTAAGNLANNLSPSLGSSTGPANNNASIMSTLENAQLSPLMQGQSWAAMMQTPLMSSFGPNNQANNDGTFPGLDMSTNGNANKQSQHNNNWAANSQNPNSNIVLDDAKKFRRTGRTSDAGFDGIGMGMQGMRNAGASTGANGSSSNNGNAAAMAAQQNWRNMNSPMSGNTGLPNTAGLASPDLSNLATLQAAMQQLNNANGGAAGMQSPQVAMANLLAAQQQIQQQMQLQQLMAGMSPMAMMNNLQNQQMLSPLLGGLGVGMNMPSSANSSNRDRRSPRPSDRSTFGNSSSGKSNSGAGQNSSGAGSGTNADEPIDINLLSDIPAWLRVLRLHKYTTTFESSNWKDMIMMTNADLENKGVAALGARRKLLKVFENIRNAQGIPHPPGSEVPGGDDAKSEAPPENPAWAALYAEVQRDLRLLRGDN